MKVWLMQPATQEEALIMTRIAWFAARRCRTDKNHDALMAEVNSTTTAVMSAKLWHSIHTEWAVDLLRHSIFTFDLEGFPQWFWAEIGRHKFIKENMEIEQRSERAIPSYHLPVLNPFRGADAQRWDDAIQFIHRFMQDMADKGYSKDDIRNCSFQGVLTPRVMSMNAETVHHLVWMRGSKELVGEFGGKAAPLFQEMTQQMWDLCRERCPWMFQQLLGKGATHAND